MMQNKKSRKSRLVLVISAVVISSFVAFGLFLFWNYSSTTKADEIRKPSFSFDIAASPGWWSRGNNWPNINDYTGDQIPKAELPVADINVSKGAQDRPGECFVMAFYNKGSVDINATLKQRESGMVLGEKDPSILKQVAVVTQRIETPEGTKEYSLYQYDLDKPQVQRGNEFGIIPLSDGYIEVRGICATADQLQSTFSAVSAIKLNP